MRRLVSLGALTAGALALALLSCPSPAGVSAQVRVRVEFREPPPSCAQAIQSLGLEGQPVNCEEPPPPSYDPPQMYGNYRLFPESYVGPLTYEDSPDAAPLGVVSDDLQTIKMSSIYAEPGWLPVGYALSSINTNDVDSERVIAATYTGPGDPIEIDRVRRFEWPIDIIEPAGDSPTVYETLVLDGVPAVVSYPAPGSSLWADGTVLRFVEGDVETIVVGRHLNPDTATQIGLSLICGASCVSPPAADAAGAGGGVSPASSLATTRGDQADASVPDGGASPTTEVVEFPTEHRVIAGLGITSVKALYWYEISSYWHGWWAPEYEYALDLQHPDGASATDGLPVYVITWAWGGGSLGFLTWDYSQSTQCTGRYVDLKDSGDNLVGRLTYVHLESMPAAGDMWPSNATGWTIRYVGNVASEQPNCDYTTIHLHQGRSTLVPGVSHNTAVPDDQGRINPTNQEPPTNNWMFRTIFPAPEDWDGDGCTDAQETGMEYPFDPYNYWDFYVVPVGANPDPTPGGGKDRAVTRGDVLAVLLYVGTAYYRGPNPNGVDYNSYKDGDWNGDTEMNVYDKVGLRYDRSPSVAPGPPWDAGPPDGAVNMPDVLAALAQVGLNCAGGGPDDGPDSGSTGEGGALDSAPNAMAVDAVSGGSINQSRLVVGGNPFDIDVVVTTAGVPYAGYNLALSYDDQVLEFVPTVDLDGDTTLESWTYTGLGGMSINAKSSLSDADGDTVVDNAVGGSARSSGTTSATGAVITGRFRCIGNGTSAVHLVTPSASPAGATTLGVGGATIDTSLADATVWCWVSQ